ncbi:MAG: YgaP-like transmembrane domain [candidate division WOR-3 bacterium]
MNVGTCDAIIRAVIGWFLIHMSPILKASVSKPLKIILMVIGIILIITAITRYCGLYSLLRISTM